MSRLTLILAIPILTALAGACGSSAIGPCAGDQTIEGCGQQCSTDEGCPTGLHCGNGACTAECKIGGTECGSDETCDSRGNCVPATSRPDAGPRDAPNCPDVKFKPEGKIPAVHLLLDQSGSMNAEVLHPGLVCDPAPEGADEDKDDCHITRYLAMRTALVGTDGVVTKLADRVIFGASLYTGIEANPDARPPRLKECPRLFTKPRAADNFTAIRDLLAPNRLGDDTPTGASIDALVADFQANPPPANSTPIILLATDGLPDTCTDPDPDDAEKQENANQETVRAAQRAFTAKIPIYVLGMGNEVGAAHLQQMANAGAGKDPKTGTEKFYQANDTAALAAALAEIIGGVRTCTFTLDQKVSSRHADSGVVKLDGKELTFNTEWKLLDDNVTIELVGTACQTFLDLGGEIDASFPCGAVID